MKSLNLGGNMLTVEEILKATGGMVLSEGPERFSGVSIDSRTISEGEIFFALRGGRFDGHDFLGDALSRGAGAVVDRRPKSLPAGKVVIQVRDTLKALQDLANHLRRVRDIPVVAITGSNGKTTTKEMTHAILSKRFRVLKNEGNLNNQIGLSLSLTRLTPDTQVVVLELGMNASGEIRRLCEIAEPDYGVITNIGSAHIGRLGSREAIRDAKLEVLEGLQAVVANADDDFLMEGLYSRNPAGRIVTFSINRDSSVTARDVQVTTEGIRFKMKLLDGSITPISMRVQGLFNVYNALAASAVCLLLGSSVDEIKSALEEYRAFPMRFEIMRRNGITLINDSYNANPSSMEEALKELIRLGDRGRVVAILGDMYELGDYTEEAHTTIGRLVAEMDIDVFVAVGEKMALAAEEARRKGDKEVYAFKDTDTARKGISSILKPGDTVLLKGSRLMGLERILGELRDVI